jgi:hypothetical protein
MTDPAAGALLPGLPAIAAISLGWLLVAWEVLEPPAGEGAGWRRLIRRFSGFDAGDVAPLWPADPARLAGILRADLLRSAGMLGAAALLVAGGLALAGRPLAAGLAGAPLLLAAIGAFRERELWREALREAAPEPSGLARLVRTIRLRLTLTRLIGAPLGLCLSVNAALAGHALAPWLGGTVAILTLAGALYRALYRP